MWCWCSAINKWCDEVDWDDMKNFCQCDGRCYKCKDMKDFSKTDK